MDPFIEETLRSLERNRFRALYAEDVAAAREEVLRLIPKGSRVGIGDSVSVRQLDVLDELQTHGRLLVNPFSEEISSLSLTNEVDEDQRKEMHRLALASDVFITGTNAVTRGGILVNTDCGGNRVAGMIFGPDEAVIVVGRNKIVRDLGEALQRIKNVIAPRLAEIKGMRVPCVAAGRCVDCDSEERLCNVTTILEKAPTYTAVTVIIVDEDLGLGWSRDWSQERIDHLFSACDELTWLRRRRSATQRT